MRRAALPIAVVAAAIVWLWKACEPPVTFSHALRRQTLSPGTVDYAAGQAPNMTVPLAGFSTARPDTVPSPDGRRDLCSVGPKHQAVYFWWKPDGSGWYEVEIGPGGYSPDSFVQLSARDVIANSGGLGVPAPSFHPATVWFEPVDGRRAPSRTSVLWPDLWGGAIPPPILGATPDNRVLALERTGIASVDPTGRSPAQTANLPGVVPVAFVRDGNGLDASFDRGFSPILFAALSPDRKAIAWLIRKDRESLGLRLANRLRTSSFGEIGESMVLAVTDTHCAHYREIDRADMAFESARAHGAFLTPDSLTWSADGRALTLFVSHPDDPARIDEYVFAAPEEFLPGRRQPADRFQHR